MRRAGSWENLVTLGQHCPGRHAAARSAAEEPAAAAHGRTIAATAPSRCRSASASRGSSIKSRSHDADQAMDGADEAPPAESVAPPHAAAGSSASRPVCSRRRLVISSALAAAAAAVAGVSKPAHAGSATQFEDTPGSRPANQSRKKQRTSEETQPSPTLGRTLSETCAAGMACLGVSSPTSTAQSTQHEMHLPDAELSEVETLTQGIAQAVPRPAGGVRLPGFDASGRWMQQLSSTVNGVAPPAGGGAAAMGEEVAEAGMADALLARGAAPAAEERVFGSLRRAVTSATYTVVSGLPPAEGAAAAGIEAAATHAERAAAAADGLEGLHTPAPAPAPPRRGLERLSAFDPLGLGRGGGPRLRVPGVDNVEAQLLVCSLRYAIIGAAASASASTGAGAGTTSAERAAAAMTGAAASAVDAAAAAADALAASGSSAHFLSSLALGCAAGIFARAVVGGGLALVRSCTEGASPTRALRDCGRAALAAAAAPLPGVRGSPGTSASAARLSRAAGAGALQLAVYTFLSGSGALQGAIPDEERLLVAGAIAGVVSVLLARPMDNVWRKGVVSAARAAVTGEHRPRAAAATLVAAADVTAVAAVEATCAALGLDPVYCV